jgi:hypothetical protein
LSPIVEAEMIRLGTWSLEFDLRLHSDVLPEEEKQRKVQPKIRTIPPQFGHMILPCAPVHPHCLNVSLFLAVLVCPSH